VLGWSDDDDGCFFIPLEHYMTHFVQTSVCFTVAEYLCVNEANHFDEESAFYEFELKQD
jgi:hypothetical protein